MSVTPAKSDAAKSDAVTSDAVTSDAVKSGTVMSDRARSRLLTLMRPVLVLGLSAALLFGGTQLAFADDGADGAVTVETSVGAQSATDAATPNESSEQSANQPTSTASEPDPSESNQTSTDPTDPSSDPPAGSDPGTGEPPTSQDPSTTGPDTQTPSSEQPSSGPTTDGSVSAPETTEPAAPSTDSGTRNTATQNTATPPSTTDPTTRTAATPASTGRSAPSGSATTTWSAGSSTTAEAASTSRSSAGSSATAVSTAATSTPTPLPTVGHQITWSQDTWNDSTDSGGSSATSCPGAESSQGQDAVSYETARFAGALLSADQQRTAVTVIAVGKALKISERGIRVALAAALQESSLQPWAVHDRYVGLFQQMYDATTGLYGDYDRLDPVGATRMFYAQLVKLVPKYAKDRRPDWQIAEAVQQTNVGRYFDARKPVALALLKEYYAGTDAYSFEPIPEPVCDTTAPTTSTTASGTTGVAGSFDPGMIISDQVFYNTKAMTEAQVRAFIAAKGAACTGQWCLRNLKVATTDQPADRYCAAYEGSASDDAAAVVYKAAVACGLNPQVMLVTLQKESGLLDRTSVSQASYAAAYGWHCPDSGPGGTANCDPAYAGFFAQAYGMAKQWSRYKMDPQKYHYQSGETAEVLWNVVESGCGGSTVHIRNVATASLYNYTPYQPNAASLASYPGTGDACSSYGNRNFYYLFGQYFGTTGTVAVQVKGVDVTLPDSPAVPGALVGKTIKAPNTKVAKGLAAGLAALGTPYVWGGGTNGGPADEGCSRGGGALNSCQGIVGYDCSGLTGYVLRTAGYAIGTDSSTQRSNGANVAWSQGRPGDIVGYPGHVAIYLGTINGVGYVLEAPDVGRTVSIRAVYGSPDSVLHRYWS